MSPKSNCPPKSQGRLTRVETFVLSAVMIWRLALERLNGLYGLSSKAPIGPRAQVYGNGTSKVDLCLL